jgi:3-phosphoglycerate kinase
MIVLGRATDKAAALQPGEVLLLENLRFYKEEEKGDKAFAEKLSKLGTMLCKRCIWYSTQGTCFNCGDC